MNKNGNNSGSTGFDRRTSQRKKLMESVRYTTRNGSLGRGELINLGNGGARLVVCYDVEVGDKFMVLHQASENVTLRSDVEVKWARPLPGGLRQVVGVLELRTTVIPTRSRSTVSLG